jgi:hypothetical protein
MPRLKQALMFAPCAKSARLLGIVTAASIVLAFSSVAHGQTDPAIRDFFLRVDRAVGSVTGKTGASAQTECLGFVRALLDVRSVAQRAAAGVWNRMSAAQRSGFREAVERRAARECVAQSRNNDRAPVLFVGVRSASGGDRLLATRVEQKSRAGRTVVWRLPASGAPSPLRALDLLVDGRSTVLTLRDEVSDILDRKNGDIDALIKTLGR